MDTRVIQINLNRSRAAQALLDKTMEERKTDVALIQEPNEKMTRNGRFYRDKNADAAILIPRGSRVKIMEWGRGEGYVWIRTPIVTFVSCYCSPNCPITDYETYLDNIRKVVRKTTHPKIIAGDFNAKSHLWEETRTDRRGELLANMIGSLDLAIINQGNAPTCQRHNGCSIVDVTFATSGIAAKVTKWKVDEERESLSDHNYIFFCMEGGAESSTPKRIEGWKITETGLAILKKEAEKWTTAQGRKTLTEILTKLCNKCLTRKKNKRGKRGVHWWCKEVAEARTKCTSARRTSQRTNKKATATDEEKHIAKLLFRTRKKELRVEVEKAKAKSWTKLLEELNEDVWGLGYKIVTEKLKRTRLDVSPEDELTQCKLLFPDRHTIEWERLSIHKEENDSFTEDEVRQAAKSAKSKRAPGPDGIPAEVIKAVAEGNVTLLQSAYNRLWKSATFPLEWKVSRLILIEKQQEGKYNPLQRKFRPICLMSTVGKTYERLIKVRLERELERTEELYEHQYGFRSGRSTVDAVRKVLEIADNVNKVHYSSRGFCLLITLDIKNAFNSLRWEVIVNELRRRGVCSRVQKVIQDYLKDRKITTEKNGQMNITCGVPQGSVLGPTLWNVAYDRVLKQGNLHGTTLIAFADDLAVVVCGKDTDELKDRAAAAVSQITAKLHSLGLQLATQKTEMVILSGRRKLKELQINLDENGDDGVPITIKSQDALKYLGVTLDKDAKLKRHAIETAKKGHRQVAALSRIMPNLNGPRENKRRIYASVIQSTVLYAAPAWHRVWRWAKYEKMLEALNRTVALRVIRGYRTVSLEASLVLAGLIPFKLLADERKRIYEGEPKTAARIKTMEAWQERWTNSRNCWTKEVIPSIDAWVGRNSKAELTYYATQMLTGHGMYNSYRKRIGKTLDASCRYCGWEDENAEHTLFTCTQWEDERRQMNTHLGTTVSRTNLVHEMTKSETNWSAVTSFMTTVMKAKERNETDLER